MVIAGGGTVIESPYVCTWSAEYELDVLDRVQCCNVL